MLVKMGSMNEKICQYCKGIHYSLQNARRCELRHTWDKVLVKPKVNPEDQFAVWIHTVVSERPFRMTCRRAD